MNRVDPKLFDGIAGRKIANFHPDHLKQLVTLIAQMLNLADENGVIITPAGYEPEEKNEIFNQPKWTK